MSLSSKRSLLKWSAFGVILIVILASISVMNTKTGNNEISSDVQHTKSVMARYVSQTCATALNPAKGTGH